MHCYRTFVSLAEFMERWEVFGSGSHNPSASLAHNIASYALADDSEGL